METEAIGMGGDLSVVRTLISLIMVLGMMIGAYVWLKKKSGAIGVMQRRMRVVERLPIDTRRSLLLVQVDGRELMLGVTNDTISTLKVLDDAKEPEHA